MKTKTKLSTLKKQLDLWREDGVNETGALKAKMAVYLNDREITDEEGKPIEIEAVYLETGFKEDDKTAMTPEEQGKAIGAAVQKAVKDTFSAMALPENFAKALNITGGEPRHDDKRKFGFKDVGDYLSAVIGSCRTKDYDPRFKAAPSVYGQELVGTDGGFAVPPDFLNQIMTDQLGEESLLGRCNIIKVNGNSITVPTDETTPWQSTGGIQAYWTPEAAAMTQSKPQLKQATLQLNKLTILVPMTDELLTDATALTSYLPGKVNQNLDYKLGDAIFRGLGSGIPLGFLNSGTLVTVAKESSQSAASVIVQNVANMLARRVNPGSKGWVWFINPDVVPQLLTMTLGNVPAFLPFNAPVTGATGSPILGYLFGIPVMVTQHANTLGTVGDIVLTDLSQYLAAVKTTGVDAQASIHLWFDQDITAFRFVFRMAGQPWRSTPVAPQFGTNNLSSFIALATLP